MAPRKKAKYAADIILAEKDGKYLIKWQGRDPKTKKPYEPTWEPKGYANRALVKDY
ncbi:hypothetical protein GQ43DRAFT_368875, partial [Delitschia confertaspora ATCC 74209]